MFRRRIIRIGAAVLVNSAVSITHKERGFMLARQRKINVLQL